MAQVLGLSACPPVDRKKNRERTRLSQTAVIDYDWYTEQVMQVVTLNKCIQEGPNVK